MKYIFIRHGKTEYNEQRKYCGSTDTGLSELGRAELETADVQAYLKEDTPDLVFCSPMLRAQETADLLFSDFPALPLLLSQELREIDFGKFEGKSYEELKDDPEYTAWLDTNCEGLIPDGDFPDRFREDVCLGFESIRETCETEGVSAAAIVTHGGVIGAILEKYAVPEKHWYEWHIPCGGYIVAEGDNVLNVTKLGGGSTC